MFVFNFPKYTTKELKNNICFLETSVPEVIETDLHIKVILYFDILANLLFLNKIKVELKYKYCSEVLERNIIPYEILPTFRFPIVILRGYD